MEKLFVLLSGFFQVQEPCCAMRMCAQAYNHETDGLLKAGIEPQNSNIFSSVKTTNLVAQFWVLTQMWPVESDLVGVI